MGLWFISKKIENGGHRWLISTSGSGSASAMWYHSRPSNVLKILAAELYHCRHPNQNGTIQTDPSEQVMSCLKFRLYAMACIGSLCVTGTSASSTDLYHAAERQCKQSMTKQPHWITYKHGPNVCTQIHTTKPICGAALKQMKQNFWINKRHVLNCSQWYVRFTLFVKKKKCS